LNRYRLDLDELVPVAEQGHAEQRAGHVVIAEEGGYLVKHGG
jgi:hypothetical protein